jgi:hypothetical protein
MRIKTYPSHQDLVVFSRLVNENGLTGTSRTEQSEELEEEDLSLLGEKLLKYLTDVCILSFDIAAAQSLYFPHSGLLGRLGVSGKYRSTLARS